LLITAADRDFAWFEAGCRVDAGDLVMRAGRPVLLVPPTAATLSLDRILVGWKDTREARRAIADALPLLAAAGQVTVVEIAAEGELPAARTRLGEVAAWLERHGVGVRVIAAPGIGEDAPRLRALATQHRADVIVGGAYGHSRMREWVLGGVTREVLLRGDRCAFVCH
jgi:nucleotide-binding universal stress UspA family protein